jgi:hypothetical protein
MMEAGLERSEIEDYTFSVMRKQMLVQMMRKDEESGLYGDEPQSIH